MSLSHFDEKSGTVPCHTPWGKWWQTVHEVYIEVDVPNGTRGKDCEIAIKPGYIKCVVSQDVIFEGEFFEPVVSDECTWSVEEQKRISILLVKAQKYSNENSWKSLLIDQYVPDAMTQQEMLKKLDLEKFQIENDAKEDDHEEGAENDSEASSPPQSPNEVQISEAEGSDNEGEKMDKDSEGSGDESENEEKSSGDHKRIEQDNEAQDSDREVSAPEDNQDSDHEVSAPEDNQDSDHEGSAPEDNQDSDHEGSAPEDNQDSDHEGSVPEINIQSDEEKESEDEQEVSNKQMEVDEHSDAEQHEEADNERENDQAQADDEQKDIDETINSQNVDDEEEGEEHEKDEHHSPRSSPAAVVASDDEDEEIVRKPQKKQNASSDAEESDKELITDIFGDSDEEYKGMDEDEIRAAKQKKQKRSRLVKVMSDSEGEEEEEKKDEAEDEHAEKQEEEQNKEEEEGEEQQAQDAVMREEEDDDEDDDGNRSNFISDFDLMMQKKKDESSKRRKRKDVDIINDSDDLIADIIVQMRQAAEEDRELNKTKRTATKKLKILPLVMSQLKKHDLKMAFLDQGILNAMADWLTPLPDRSLPNLQIREGMIKRLNEFPSIDQSLLKSSGIGRALMYLYRHPKETKENKERAGKLITAWSRPIFNVTTNYHSLTKEEREQRDYDHVPKRRKQREQVVEQDEEKDIDKALNEGSVSVRPGDKGWVGRARVPMPSTKDYVHRPKWNVEMELSRSSSKKPLNRFERHMRTFQEKKKLSKAQRAVTISIEGRKMAI